MADTEGRVVSPSEALALVGVVAVCLLVPLFPGRLPLGGFPLDAITLSIPLALLLSFPLLRRLGARGLPPVGMLATGIVFLTWALVSVALSQHVAASLATWSRYLMYFLLVVVVAAATREWWSRRIVMWSLVFAGTVTCVMGLLQYLNPDSKQAIGLQGLESTVATRVFATFDNPNFFAEFLLLLFAVTLALALAESGALRWLALLLCAGQAVILVLTYTRGSWLALAVGIVIMALMIDARWLWAFTALGVGVLAAAPGALLRLVSAFSLEGTAGFRLRLWRVTGEIIAAHPIAGVGIGGFVPAFKLASLAHPELATGFLIYGAHESYYTIAAETGVIGAVAFIAVVFTCARMGLFYAPRMRSDRRAFLANAALTAGLVGFGLNALTSNSFQHPQAAVFFWVIVGLQAGLGAAFWDRAPQPRPAHPARLHAPRWLADSYVGRGTAAFVAWLPKVWTNSDVDRLLTGKPVGADTILRGSRLLGLLLGQGKTAAGQTRPGIPVAGAGYRSGRGVYVERSEDRRPDGILLVSNMYPSAADPVFGSFVARQEEAFRSLGVRVRLVANRDPRPGGVAAATKYPSLLARALWAARKRDFSVVVGHFIYPTAIIAGLAARLSGRPLVLVVHGTDIKSARGTGVLARWTRDAVSRACLVIAVSGDLAGQVRDLGTGVPVAVCHMGVDTRRFTPVPDARSRLGLDPEERMAIYVGNLIPRKNVALLIDAFARLRATPGVCDRVVVIGNGPLEEDLHRQVSALGLDDSVTFVDQIPQEQLPPWLSAADIFVLPSLYEGLGLVLLEAMGCGTPVAGPRVGGVPEVVDDEVGALYTRADAEALASAMRAVLQAGKARFADACVRRAADNDLVVVADRFLSQIMDAGCSR